MQLLGSRSIIPLPKHHNVKALTDPKSSNFARFLLFQFEDVFFLSVRSMAQTLVAVFSSLPKPFFVAAAGLKIWMGLRRLQILYTTECNADDAVCEKKKRKERMRF